MMISGLDGGCIEETGRGARSCRAGRQRRCEDI